MRSSIWHLHTDGRSVIFKDDVSNHSFCLVDSPHFSLASAYRAGDKRGSTKGEIQRGSSICFFCRFDDGVRQQGVLF